MDEAVDEEEEQEGQTVRKRTREHQQMTNNATTCFPLEAPRCPMQRGIKPKHSIYDSCTRELNKW